MTDDTDDATVFIGGPPLYAAAEAIAALRREVANLKAAIVEVNDTATLEIAALETAAAADKSRIKELEADRNALLSVASAVCANRHNGQRLLRDCVASLDRVILPMLLADEARSALQPKDPTP